MKKLYLSIFPVIYLSLVSSGWAEEKQVLSGDDKWIEIFRKAPKLIYQSLNTGTCYAPKSGLLNLEHPKARGLKDGPLSVPVFSHIFRHEVLGDFAIDTGLGRKYIKTGIPDFKTPPKGTFSPFYFQEPGQDIVSNLKKLGFAPEKIFLTHLHFDHTAAMDELPVTNIYYYGSKEKYFGGKPIAFWEDFKIQGRAKPIDFQKGEPIPPFDSVIDVFGDESFWAISTPGHTTDHVSYLAITTSGPVLFTGDASHTKWGFENGVEPGWVSNRIKAQKSLEALRNFTRKYPNVKVVYGHEK